MGNLSARIIVSFLVVLLLVSAAIAAPLLNPSEPGIGGQTRDSNYDSIIDSYFSDGRVVSVINGNQLWVPWFKTSSSSLLTDLQNGANCNSGQAIDFSHNCMVTDEFSQIGILIAMGKDQARMDQFYNTVIAAKSTNGNLPGWRIYRNGNTIEACRPGINGNCDTASDGTARIIISLYTASKNPNFGNAGQKANYAALAKKLADDMLTYEVDKTCRPTSFGTVCNWLAGGSNVKTAGISASDFAYTGYYPDAIIAMLSAYANTQDPKYSAAARDFSINYLQAANFNNQGFSVPPGKSFKWVVDSSGIPRAQCTNTCNPAVWDMFDASRALGICQANYYATQMNIQLPSLQKYCDLLSQRHMSNPASAPLQFYPDGSAVSSQSGYFAQGLEALHQSGGNPSQFRATLDNALSHYNVGTRTFDNAPSIGVYTTSFCVRALGMGIGRDASAFGIGSTPAAQPAPSPANSTPSQAPNVTGPGISALVPTLVYGAASTQGALKSDSIAGVCRTIVWSTNSGDIQLLGCVKDSNYVELYKQAAPINLVYKACLANGCITQDNGFARFLPIIPAPIVPPVPPAVPPSAQPPVPPIQPTPQPYTGVASLRAVCTYNAQAATLKSDVTSGCCRTVVFGTASGNIQLQACEKSGGVVEVYRQLAPQGLDFQACMGSGCIDKSTGFAQFNPTLAQPAPITQPPAQPIAQPPTQPPVQPIAPTYSGVASLGISCTYNTHIAALKSDVTSGSCRTVVFGTTSGNIQLQACEKSGGVVEVYRQLAPQGLDFQACIGSACVSAGTGFAKISI